MSIRASLSEAARRILLGLSRGTFVSADDSKKMQEHTVRDRFGEIQKGVEYWQPHGFSHVPLPPDKAGEAEVLISYFGGSRSHPAVIATADRRHRPKDMKPGDVAFFDHRGQTTVFSKDGVTHRTPLTITHTTVDKDGKTTSSLVQKPDGTVTITNKDGATLVMDGPNIKTKVGKGGKHIVDGDIDVKGGLTAAKTIAGQAVTSGGQPVRTV